MPFEGTQNANLCNAARPATAQDKPYFRTLKILLPEKPPLNGKRRMKAGVEDKGSISSNKRLNNEHKQ